MTSQFRRGGRARGPAAESGVPWKFTARAAYVVVVAVATLSNLGFEPTGVEELARRLLRALSPALTPRDLVDGLRNLLLFTGWGLVWCFTAPQARLRRAVVMATLTGMLLSIGVEGAQLFSTRRHASVLDVFTNTAGSLAGGVAAVLLLYAAQSARATRSFFGLPMFVFATGYGTAAMLEIVLPGLRQELLPRASGGPIARFALALTYIGWGDNGFGTLLLQMMLMVPAGAFTLSALVESGRSYGRAMSITASAGVVLAMILEFARGATGQPVELGMFGAHAIGIVSGAWLATWSLPLMTRHVSPRARPLLLLAGYAVALLLWAWRPFVPHFRLDELRASFSALHIVPLAALAMKGDMFTAADVAISFMLHLPVGALLAVWPLRQRGWLAHILPGIWLVGFIEAGQLLIQGRFFDSTDILIGASGVLAGWGLMRRSGFLPRGEALDRAPRSPEPQRRS